MQPRRNQNLRISRKKNMRSSDMVLTTRTRLCDLTMCGSCTINTHEGGRGATRGVIVEPIGCFRSAARLGSPFETLKYYWGGGGGGGGYVLRFVVHAAYPLSSDIGCGERHAASRVCACTGSMPLPLEILKELDQLSKWKGKGTILDRHSESIKEHSIAGNSLKRAEWEAI